MSRKNKETSPRKVKGLGSYWEVSAAKTISLIEKYQKTHPELLLSPNRRSIADEVSQKASFNREFSLFQVKTRSKSPPKSPISPPTVLPVEDLRFCRSIFPRKFLSERRKVTLGRELWGNWYREKKGKETRGDVVRRSIGLVTEGGSGTVGRWRRRRGSEGRQRTFSPSVRPSRSSCTAHTLRRLVP